MLLFLIVHCDSLGIDIHIYTFFCGLFKQNFKNTLFYCAFTGSRETDFTRNYTQLPLFL